MVFFKTISVPPVQDLPSNPCYPSPCGSNAICKEHNNAGSCTCLPEYYGDPYVSCRPECVTNSDCSREKTCINNKCKDPCIGACGVNAECRVVNHSPSCICLPGYEGNPTVSCHLPIISMLIYVLYLPFFRLQYFNLSYLQKLFQFSSKRRTSKSLFTVSLRTVQSMSSS